MAKTKQQQLLDLAANCVGWQNLDPYQYPKDEFHRVAMAYLRDLAARMQLPLGSYQVRSNKGGHAVLGECVLHAQTFYLQVGPGLTNETPFSIMFRTCNGFHNYASGPNNWPDFTAWLEGEDVLMLATTWLKSQNPDL